MHKTALQKGYRIRLWNLGFNLFSIRWQHYWTTSRDTNLHRYKMVLLWSVVLMSILLPDKYNDLFDLITNHKEMEANLQWSGQGHGRLDSLLFLVSELTVCLNLKDKTNLHYYLRIVNRESPLFWNKRHLQNMSCTYLETWE